MLLISEIGSLLKINYRVYINEVLARLEKQGFNDLRPSFLEVLFVILEEQGLTMKQIGSRCGLKKQTMTTHVSELQKRGYISKVQCSSDKRAQRINLTEVGEDFKMHVRQCMSEVDSFYKSNVGEVILLQLKEHLKTLNDKNKSL